jgi:imidazolonepropionase-like amidohydrolase
MVAGMVSLRRALLATALVLWAIPARGEPMTYTAIFGGKNVGHLIADTRDGVTSVDWDVKNNGRGPTIKETIKSDAAGFPSEWTISGTTAFGSKVEEHFSQTGGAAEWLDSIGKGNASPGHSELYVPQSGGPWQYQILLHALLKAPGMSLPALPAGTLRLQKGETLTVKGDGGPMQVTRYDLTGIDLTPEILLVDDKGRLFADVHTKFIVVRKGYESEEMRLRKLASDWITARLVALEKRAAHRFAGPVRIENVRLFDPKTSTLTAAVSVVIRGREIAAIEPLDSPRTAGEVIIDGAGGTLVAGMFEMHGHLSQDDALLNVVAGVTSLRDMGNDNAVLDTLTERIESGQIGGPHVIRSGLIEGKSPFNNNMGIVVDSEPAALEAVRWYGARGFWQIKIYNSTNPAWVPAMVKEAHRLGMRVAGHVPAFATADQMIAAGYDEMTHINQFMLGWVMKEGEDTRTLFRLTAMKRFPSLDLKSERLQHTIQMMVNGHKVIDPTLGIHERLTMNEDGKVPPGAVDYLDHMPIGYRREAMKAMSDQSAPGDADLYHHAWDKILATTKALHDRGVFIVFGTDTGGSFSYHRELEIYQQAGIMTAPAILKRATYESAKYLGQEQRLGSIEKGKLADLFLVPGDPTKSIKAIKTIRMVVKEGVFYFPSEVYPSYGIEPFADPPSVALPSAK